MPGRSFNSSNYRFGFNGKENDRHWGDQLIQDYGFRLYNPAIGKFLSVDPLSQAYPFYTPYQFAGNKPIWAVDLDGLEPQIKTKIFYDYAPLPNNTAPRDIHDFGNTRHDVSGRTLKPHPKSGEKRFFSINYNKKKNKFDVKVYIEVRINAGLNPSCTMCDLNGSNPGLSEEVLAHEEGHVEQWKRAYNSKITIEYNGKKYSGFIDEVITNAENDIKAGLPQKFKSEEDMKKAQNKYEIGVGQVINKALNAVFERREELMAKDQTGKPDAEIDANNYADKELKNSRNGKGLEYANGKKRATYRGKSVDLGVKK